MNVHPSTPKELALAEQFLKNPARGKRPADVYEQYYAAYTRVYGNQSIANHLEMDRILDNMPVPGGTVLSAMRALVGTPGPVKAR